MANITRFDPFSANVDDLFRGMFLQPVRFDLGTPDVQIKLNVVKSDGSYNVEAELTGVKKEDIHVAVDGPVVTISGEVKNEKEQKKGDQVIRSERYYGKVERSFSLPQPVDQAKVVAKYADGVLKLTLPMTETTKPKEIAIG